MNRFKNILEFLIKRGQELLDKPYEYIEFTGEKEADSFF